MASSSVHLLCAVFLITLASLGSAYTNISLGTIISPLGPTTSWLSPSGDFAVGFIPIDDYSLFAVWYANIPEQTVVWSARTRDPLTNSSRLLVDASSGLVLSNGSGKQVWARPGGPVSIAYAAILDSGNLVTVSASSGSFAWQSFHDPGDTLLPTQSVFLPIGINVVAHAVGANYSDGRYKFTLQADGNLALYYVALHDRHFNYENYWAIIGVGIVFDGSGNLYSATKGGGFKNVTSAGTMHRAGAYQRVTLDPDGVLRHYVYSNEGPAPSKTWVLADWVPRDICWSLVGKQNGGYCGYNAHCAMFPGGYPTCSCLPGFSYVDASRQYMGCKSDFPAQACAGAASIGDGSVDYSMIRNPFANETLGGIWHYDRMGNLLEAECSQECLHDCLCFSATYLFDGSCYKMALPLAYWPLQTTSQATIFLKVPNQNYTAEGPNGGAPVPRTECPRDSSRAPPANRGWISTARGLALLVTSAALNAVLLAAVPLAVVVCYKCRRPAPDGGKMEQGGNVRSFTFRELREATGGFAEELGRGASGAVYKGELSVSGAKLPVAVKRLEPREGRDEAFRNEVRAVGETRHKNLLRLLGVCAEEPHRILVYEFASMGSLACFLFEEPWLDWEKRVNLIFGVASGLRYLHEECDTRIIHFDIKPQNILVDESFCAKISDFGLAKVLWPEQASTSTEFRGTRGYAAPELLRAAGRKVSAKVDVYSFGILMLEMLFCRRSIVERGREEADLLPVRAYDCYKKERLDMLLHDSEAALVDMMEMERLLRVAFCCIEENPLERPEIKQVMLMLEGAIPSIPLDPFRKNIPW